MHAELKHYLDQPQDKDCHEGEDLRGMRHGNPSVWFQNLDCQQQIMGVRWFDFVSNAYISSTMGLGDVGSVIWLRCLALLGLDHAVPV